MSTNQKDYSKLSPFELKDFLIEVAKDSKGGVMLNAGRGNPNFLSMLPREAFFEWGHFALSESERSFSFLSSALGGFPMRSGIEGRIYNYLQNKNTEGCKFIQKAISYVRDQLGYCSETFIYEMTEGVLGIMYPVPDRMLPLSEKIVGEYIKKEMFGHESSSKTEFDLFATEGGTAAITYLFDTLKENSLLVKGDCIAMATPIFTPYLEIPELMEYELIEMGVEEEDDKSWQISDANLEKLLDPKIKAFFLVNPSNPPSVKMSDEKLEKLASIIEKRPDLIVLTDDVYGTFAEDFTSIFAKCPHNTILVYSYSKYFGSTGWRLGVIATAKDSILDKLIKDLPESERKRLNERYSSISLDPPNFKFIDRIVAESRAVGLNHTAGLSTPQQVQMVLFSLFSLMDAADNYKNDVKRLVRKRRAALYNELGVEATENNNDVNYYNIIEVSSIAEKLYSKEFKAWLLETMEPNEILFRLAKEASTVLLPASGFGTSDPGFRVSLANLNEYDYVKIGKAVQTVLHECYEEFKLK